MQDLHQSRFKRIVLHSILLLSAACYLTGCCGSGTNTTTVTHSGGGTTTPTNRPVFVVVTPDGKFVYVADAGANSIAQYSVGTNGALTPLSPAMVTGLNKPRAIAVSEDSQYVYVGNQGDNTVAAFKIGSTGALTSLSQTPVKISGIPSSLVTGGLSTTFNLLYVGHTGGIARFKRNNDGSLTSLGADALAGQAIADITKSDDNDGDYYLNILNASAQTVTSADVNSDGSLNVSTLTAPTGKQPAAIVNSEAGNTFFVPNQGANSISIYTNSDDAISTLTATVTAGSAPVSGADISGDGTDALLVVNSGSNTVSVFSYLNSAAPTSLQTLGNAPTGTNPAWVAITLNGQSAGYNGAYVYVANQSGSISQYVFNNGTLTPLNPASVPG